MLFTDARTHLFRPLTGKYREQVAACLHELYLRLYGALADYSRSFHREQVIEIFQEAIARAPLLDGDAGEEPPLRPPREQAGWVLNLLLEHGWIERQVDEATLQSSYGLTRHGRLFTQPMVETAGGRFRTRHRNTRNTRNALQSFLEKGEVYDLLDAFEYSERIVSDFSDVIAELDERKRQLVRAVEAQQVVQRASDEFFDFMERRFMPDLAIRLSADSVERHRGELDELIGRARRKKREFKADAERELRRAVPELLDHPKQSLYLKLLDAIESRLHSASMVMLPALRHALNSFTRRADIIIRQLSYGGGQQDRLREICTRLKGLDEAGQDAVLGVTGKALATLSLALPDPDALRLQGERRRRRVEGLLEHHGEPDRETRRDLFLHRALELAFTFNNRELRDYLFATLRDGGQIRTSELPVRNARELLMNAHAIEIGSATADSSEFRFRVEPTGRHRGNDWFAAGDEFVIELVETDER